MKPSYLTRSVLAWIAIALTIGGLALTGIAVAADLAPWLIPFGYFTALIGAGLLFVGWLRLRG
ncbi:hypothetical protein [uncultured Jannaschia sp.]|uniref:hypothetical protein n=1 Tax=uncultured Jannaschia sp. TaxID=293347 RepID=UPI0026285640|nr:hypothetical protein [uncultured Jannaschia sp.]